jgi:glycosyltransferase
VEIGGIFKGKVKNGWMPPRPTFYMKRELYQQYGLFDLSFSQNACWWGKQSKFKEYHPKTKEDIRALVNNHTPVFRAIIWKNLSKILQFFFK